MRQPLPLLLVLLTLLCRPSLAQHPPKTPAEIEAAARVQALFPGQPVHVVIDEDANSGAAVGVGGEAVGDNAQFNQNTTPPALQIGTNSGTGGGGEAGGKAKIVVGEKTLKLMVVGVGVLCLLGAGACMFLGFKVPRAPLTLGALGGGLIAVAFFPALIPIGLCAGILVMLVHLIVAERGTSKNEAISGAVIKGINDAETDTASPEAQKAAKVVKSYIETHMKGPAEWVRDAVRKAKKKLT